jgi:PAS domain S-box-containing protein
MSTESAQVMFDASPTPTLLLTQEGTVARMNDAARKMLGTRPDKILGRPILASVVPDDRERVKELFIRVLQGQRREWITRFKRGDAATRVQWVRAVRSTEDGADGILMFTRDITESREGRPEMLQLQTLLENLPGQFSAVLDVQGRIRYSSCLSRTHFRNDVDLVGLPFLDLLEPGDVSEAQLSEMLGSVLAGEHWSANTRHKRIDGTSFSVRTFASPYMHPRDGRVIGVLVAGRDVTAETELRQRLEAAERSAAIGAMVGVAGAEFERRLLRAREEGEDAESALKTAQAFFMGLGGATGVGSEPKQKLSLSAAIREVIEQVECRSVPVLFEVPEEPVHVVADAAAVRFVVKELVENGIEAALEVPNGHVRISVASGPSGALIQVDSPSEADTRSAVHRSFDPFFTTKEGRAGLGLTVARAAIQSQGGRAWVDVDAGGRTVFAVQIPFDPEQSGGRFRPVPLVLSRTRTVLVVDDEEDVRLSIRRFLERVGFEVREAWSGRSALAQITAGRPPEIVLTDLRMSDGSGAWFLEQLSRDFPDLLRRTVVMTGAAHDDDVAAMVRRTGCPLLAKPLEMPDVLELIDEVVLRN